MIQMYKTVLCLQPGIPFPLDDRLVYNILLNVHLCICIVFVYLISEFQFEIDCYMFSGCCI